MARFLRASTKLVGGAIGARPFAFPGYPLTQVRLTSTTTFKDQVMTEEGQTILSFLVRAENDAQKYYEEMAEKSKVESFRSIFTMLATEERKHLQWLQNMALGGGEMSQAVQVNTSFLMDVNNIFENMKLRGVELHKTCRDEIELYRAARDIEAQSRDFYRERAQHTNDLKLKKLLLTIAEEEDKHYRLLNGLLEFVKEDAEWFDGSSALKEDAFDLWVKMDQTLQEMGKPL